MNGCFVKLLAGAALGSVAMFGAQINTISEKYGDGEAPYTVTTNIPGLSSATVICDDDIDSWASSGSWPVVETSLTTIDGGVPSYMEFGGPQGAVGTKKYIQASTTTYQQAAYLAVEEMIYAANYSIGNNKYIVDAIQTAIWDLFCTSGCASVSNGGNESTSYWTSLVTGAGWLGTQGNNGFQAQVVAMAGEINFLTDSADHTPGGGGTGTSYQEFIVITPEPATYALFGMGLILLSLGTFRRRAKKSN